MEFLQIVSQIFGYLLPVLGTAVLIILIIVGLRALKLIQKVENSLTNIDTVVSNANNTLGNLNKTIEMANKYVVDFSVTSKTVNNVSMSIEAVRYALEQMIIKLIVKWTKEYEKIKNLIFSFFEKTENKIEEVASKKKENL